MKQLASYLTLFIALNIFASCATLKEAVEPDLPTDVTSCISSREDQGFVCSDRAGHVFRIPYANSEGYVCYSPDDIEQILLKLRKN